MAKHIKKYILHSGYVRSQTDGQYHFISAHRLIELYHLNPKECHLMDDNKPSYDNGKAIHLYPRYDGNYTLEPCVCPINSYNELCLRHRKDNVSK